jgi:HEAT repeat protein
MRARLKALFQRMGDADEVKADAAFDAILFEREGALPDLVECLEESADAQLRFLCVQLLGFTESEAAVAPILGALDDPDPGVRAEACRSLEDLRARDALGALRTRLDDVNEEVRIAAAEAILSIEGGRADED